MGIFQMLPNFPMCAKHTGKKYIGNVFYTDKKKKWTVIFFKTWRQKMIAWLLTWRKCTSKSDFFLMTEEFFPSSIINNWEFIWFFQLYKKQINLISSFAHCFPEHVELPSEWHNKYKYICFSTKDSVKLKSTQGRIW